MARGRQTQAQTVEERLTSLERELNLLLQPIAVGDGLARLFPPDEAEHSPLELLSAETFKSGVLNLRHAAPKS